VSGDAVGIRIAFASGTYDTNPTWVRIDNPSQPPLSAYNCVQSFSIDRGRQQQMDKTQAGTCVLNLLDTTGAFDPTNTSGPFYGHLGPLSQVKITMQNPVDGFYHDIYTGFIESWDTTFVDQAANIMQVTCNATDGFELLNRAETVPDSTGFTTYQPQLVHDRILGALQDDYLTGQGASWPAAWTNVFSGNVDMKLTTYNPQSTILGVIQDAADAEFPNVANVFMNRWGQVAFRGRWSRLYPQAYGPRLLAENPPHPGDGNAIYTWYVGDEAAAQSLGYVPINSIEWTMDLQWVINACLATPYNLPQVDIIGQLQTAPSSMTTYGPRSLTIPDLLVGTSVANPHAAPNGGDGAMMPESDSDYTGAVECQYFGDYYVKNYATPAQMVNSITFQTISPTDSTGPAWWKFVTNVEIGDIVFINQRNPGGGGFTKTGFFVEGVHHQVQLGGSNIPQWTMNLDLSPRQWYRFFAGSTYDITTSTNGP
jgi:hypothetical protein